MRLRIAWISRGIVLGAALACATAGFAQVEARTIPQPRGDHPGNIFLAGEEVVVTLPAAMSGAWRAVDYDGKLVAEGSGAGAVHLGRLPVGYYELRRGGDAAAAADRVFLGVLAPLGSPTPKTSPIALDVSMAWFAPKEKMPIVASLCALAGVNWVRDRLSWPDMEPQPGKWAGHTRYDTSAAEQHAAGLQVLQVNHISPSWANPDHRRFPLDLRDAYRFYREMARRWRGKVLAFEPWNEADIAVFGGQTGSEIASLQKAAYLGLKAGNPQVIACQNVFADHDHAILDDFRANEAWPYFDTFNLHHYAGVNQYPAIYADFRAVSAGRPLWVTEFNAPVKWSGDAKRQEPDGAALRIQAERVAKVYAGVLHEGAAAAFYFILPHYCEKDIQFGLIHPDLSPRPAYVVLAAVGRLLADAQPRGKLKTDKHRIHALLFHSRPDGKERLMLVAWTDRQPAALPLPARPLEAFDHLGRARSKPAAAVELSEAPVFLAFSPAVQEKFARELPPAPAPRLKGAPSAVVLQAVWPRDRVVLFQSACRVSTKKPQPIPLFVYNFGRTPVEGRLSLVAPKGWKVSLPGQVTVRPGQRVELALNVDATKAASPACATVTIRGDFATAGAAVLSLRFLPQ